MSLYEGMFIVDNRQANRDWDGSLEKLKGILVKHGAEIIRCDKWGERKLAYEMQGRRRGTYVLGYFKASGPAVTSIYRDIELSDVVVRALILKVDVVPPADQIVSGEDVPIRRGRDYSFTREPRAGGPGGGGGGGFGRRRRDEDGSGEERSDRRDASE